MEKINRDTGMETTESVNCELIKRLLNKSDELVKEYNKFIISDIGEHTWKKIRKIFKDNEKARSNTKS